MKRASLSFVILAVTGCGAENGAALQIVSSPAPDNSCLFSPENDIGVTRGVYDPFGVGPVAPYAFVLGLQLQNNLHAVEAEQAQDTTSLREDGNDVVLMGFDTCWFRADSSRIAEYQSTAAGIPKEVQCENLPAAQKAFIPSSHIVHAGGGETALRLAVLDMAALRSLYGSDFDPWNLKPAPDGTVYPIVAPSPAAQSRAAAWGDYPAQRRSLVILQLQARGRKQDGSLIESNWFMFPVEICLGCIAYSCGGAPLPRDTETSSSGVECYSGNGPVTEDVCLPFQPSLKDPECDTISYCFAASGS